jgi:hypothetical protein
MYNLYILKLVCLVQWSPPDCGLILWIVFVNYRPGVQWTPLDSALNTSVNLHAPVQWSPVKNFK